MWFAFGETEKKRFVIWYQMTVVLLFLGDNGWNSQVKLKLIKYKIQKVMISTCLSKRTLKTQDYVSNIFV